MTLEESQQFTKLFHQISELQKMKHQIYSRARDRKRSKDVVFNHTHYERAKARKRMREEEKEEQIGNVFDPHIFF